jgi:hypothetical protein
MSSLGVLIVGPRELAAPFSRGGAFLDRAIRRAGFTREQFGFFSGRIDRLVDPLPRCILALGDPALAETTGMTGPYRSVRHLTNWVLPSRWDIPVVVCYDPVYIRAGKVALMSVLMHNIKLAVAVATQRKAVFHSPVLGRDFVWANEPLSPAEPSLPTGYITHPTEADALALLTRCNAEASLLIAYDIETPWSGTKDEEESDELADREILSIQLSLGPGEGIYFPWRVPFIEVARQLLALPNPKAGANNWRFDNVVLQAHGCAINGPNHDVRWAFHHLQPDLPASLQFIASFYALECGPWKHYNSSHKEYYGIRDVDMVQRIISSPLRSHAAVHQPEGSVSTLSQVFLGHGDGTAA